MIKRIGKVLAILLIGFVGGVLAPWFVGWFKNAATVQAADAISIANTYIMFTTLFFVGVTVIMAVLGYAITHQLSQGRKAHEREALEKINDQISRDETIGIRMVDSLLSNPDVQRHVDSAMATKIEENIQFKMQEEVDNADRLACEAQTSQAKVDVYAAIFKKTGAASNSKGG